MRSALDGTIILRLKQKIIRTFFDPKKDHLLHYSARYFDEILKDVMSGFNGSNYYQRRLINESFKFEMLEPNTILVNEGQKADKFMYIVLNGKIDIRRNLPSRKGYRELQVSIIPISKLHT